MIVAASIGIVHWAPGMTDADLLVRDAEIALESARRTRGANYAVFTNEMHAQAEAAQRTRDDLYGAVERNELRLYYQPLVDIATCAVYGFEGLLRWQHPVRGMIPPNEFIPAAEETGLIIELGRWVLMEGCRTAREFQRVSGRALTMSLNVSSQQLLHRTFLSYLQEALDSSGVDVVTQQFATPRHRHALLTYVDAVGGDPTRHFRRIVHHEGHREIATDRYHRVAPLATRVSSSRSFSLARRRPRHLVGPGAGTWTCPRVRPRTDRGCACEIEHRSHLRSSSFVAEKPPRGARWKPMQIPAKAEYAIRALLTLAASESSVSAEHLAQEQELPAKFLGAIMSDLRRGGLLVTSQRGPEGGFKLCS